LNAAKEIIASKNTINERYLKAKYVRNSQFMLHRLCWNYVKRKQIFRRLFQGGGPRRIGEQT